MHAMRPKNDHGVYGPAIKAKQFQTSPFYFTNIIQTQSRWPSILRPSQPT